MYFWSSLHQEEHRGLKTRCHLMSHWSIFLWVWSSHPHLLVYPVQEVGDVAVHTQVVLPGAVPPQNTVAHEPPQSVLQGHQRAAAVRLEPQQRIFMPAACFFLFFLVSSQGLYDHSSVSTCESQTLSVTHSGWEASKSLLGGSSGASNSLKGNMMSWSAAPARHTSLGLYVRCFKVTEWNLFI